MHNQSNPIRLVFSRYIVVIKADIQLSYYCIVLEHLKYKLCFKINTRIEMTTFSNKFVPFGRFVGAKHLIST